MEVEEIKQQQKKWQTKRLIEKETLKEKRQWTLNKEKDDEKSKIKFIHLNHTNPLLDSNSNAHKKVIANGFNIGKFKEIIPL